MLVWLLYQKVFEFLAGKRPSSINTRDEPKEKEKKRGTISKSEIFCHSAQPSTYEPEAIY
jgi:hypothetical protein